MKSTPSSVALRLVNWYQRAFEGRPSPCRFTPSCSSYAKEALDIHGTRGGLWLTIRRLARCRPFGPSGFDPVPPPRPEGAHLAGGPATTSTEPHHAFVPARSHPEGSVSQ